MARAVLWDIGNVIVRWDPRTLYSKIIANRARCWRALLRPALEARGLLQAIPFGANWF